MFNSLAFGHAFRNRSANSHVSNSPLDVHSFNSGTRSPRSGACSNSALISDGTTTIRVTPCSARYFTISSGSSSTSCGTITLGTPASSGPKISHTESTNPTFVFWQHTSPASNPYRSHIQPNRLIAPPCVPSTPFGFPLDPDVYNTYARALDDSTFGLSEDSP